MNAQPQIDAAKEVFLNVYNRIPAVFERGEGCYLYDSDNKKYIDFYSGIGVNALGHNNLAVTGAIAAQAKKLTHISNLFYNEPAIKAAKRLCDATGLSKVFFTNSGAEAIEGALKIARKYGFCKNGSHNGEIIAFNSSFHGRTFGALSVTGNKAYRESFEPLIGNVSFARFNDIKSVESLINENTCAIIMETVQGEGGIYPAKPDFIKGIRKLCDEHKLLFILDEIQCGMGRSGKMFAYQIHDVLPDILTCAKALGCGFPLGAFVVNDLASTVLTPGDHGSTYVGSPLAGAVINAVFDEFDRLNILENVNKTAACLLKKLEQLSKKCDVITDIRACGLMIGIEFSIPVSDIITRAREGGLIIINAGANTIRLLPPLIIGEKEIDEMMKIFEAAI